MNHTLLIILLVLLLLVLLYVRRRQQTVKSQSPSVRSRAAKMQSHSNEPKADAPLQDDWMKQVDATVAQSDEQGWEWDGAQTENMTTSVSAQEVDPLTEYQVYKQFGYEDKAAESLGGYLNALTEPAPEKLVHELAGLCLRAGNINLLATSLARHSGVLSKESFTEYVKAGLIAEPNHLPLRVLAERELGWNTQEVARQIGEKSGFEDTPTLTVGTTGRNSTSTHHSDIVIGKRDLGEVSGEEMSAVMGFLRPDKSAKILKNKVDYPTALQQYNRAIQKTDKPASLIIDALKLDYQNQEVNQFAGHLWKLYYSLGQYGRQVKERMLGWGYSLGYHELFDDLEKSPTEQQIREIGLQKGYLQPSGRVVKAKYRELVHKDDNQTGSWNSPADAAIKEVESLLMYGQLDQAVGTLEQAVLQHPQESQLYIMLFDLYERSEDWGRLEQFLRILRQRVDSLPEEVVLAMSQLLQRVNRQVKN